MTPEQEEQLAKLIEANATRLMTASILPNVVTNSTPHSDEQDIQSLIQSIDVDLKRRSITRSYNTNNF